MADSPAPQDAFAAPSPPPAAAPAAARPVPSISAKVAQALLLPEGAIARVKGVVADAGGGWLTLTDTTDQMYAWGPPFSGDAILTGKIQKASDDRTYLLVQRIKKVKRELIPPPLVIAAILLAIPFILYFGAYYSIPDFDISDLIGSSLPPAGLSDLQKDKLTAYTVELIWHDGPKICAELRNVGKIVIGKEDLEKISFSVNNLSITWNRTAVPSALRIRKRMTMCLCTDTGEGCPAGSELYNYAQQGGGYPTIAIEIKPWFGEIKTSAKISS